MSGSDRSGSVAAVGAAIATIVTLIGTLVFTYNLGNSSGRINAQADSYTAAYPYHTSKQIDDCWRNPDRDAATKCVSDAINSSREAQRSEADLAAQRQMSDWTFWALVISSISAAVTAIGTILLYKQIDLTRKAVEETSLATAKMGEANEIARESYEAQCRAWIKISFCRPLNMYSINDRPGLYATLKFENVGQSPAIQVSYFSGLCIGYEPDSDIDVLTEIYRNRENGFEGDIFQGGDSEKKFQIDYLGEVIGLDIGYIVIAVFYRTAFSETVRKTVAFYEINDSRRFDGLVDFRHPLSSGQMNLRPWPQMPGIID